MLSIGINDDTIRYDTIRYGSIEEFNVDSNAEHDQLNLAHVTRKKYNKEESKTNKRQCPLSSVLYRFKIREGSPEGIRKLMEERICERDVFLSLE